MPVKQPRARRKATSAPKRRAAKKPTVARRRAESDGSPAFGRAMLALALLLALAVPVALFVLWDHGVSDNASGESLPISTYSDDRRHEPATPAPHSPSATPSRTPSASPTTTPSETPSEEPTTRPSQTSGPSRSETRPTQRATRPPSTTRPTAGPTVPPTSDPTTPPPPPPDGGGMTEPELQLFTMVDNARVDHGCAHLGRDTARTKAARSHSSSEAAQSSNSTGDGSEAIADASSPSAAYDQMMNNYSDVLLDCGRTELGIGYGEAQTGLLCGLLPCTTERRWSGDFGG